MELLKPLPLFLLLLLLGQLKLFVTLIPELSELSVLLLLGCLLSLFALDLQLARTFDGSFHFGLALLLLLKETIGTILSLGNLAIQDFLLVVFECTQIFNLPVDEVLAGLLLDGESLLLTLLLETLKMLSLLSKRLDLLLLFNLLAALCLLHLHQLLVCLGQVSSDLSYLLLTLDLALLLPLEVLLGLTLDKLTLEHLFFELLDVIELEVFELLADILRVLLLQFVLLLELGAHLCIVLAHLGALNLDPVGFDVAGNRLLALVHCLLGFLFVGHVAHQHLAFEGFYHVLLFVHDLGGALDLLSPQIVLVVLLFGVEASSLNLKHTQTQSWEPNSND